MIQSHLQHLFQKAIPFCCDSLLRRKSPDYSDPRVEALRLIQEAKNKVKQKTSCGRAHFCFC